MYISENISKNVSYFEFVSGKQIIEFQLTFHKSVLTLKRLGESERGREGGRGGQFELRFGCLKNISFKERVKPWVFL